MWKAVDLPAVARTEFLPRVKKNVHVTLSFKGDFFFFFGRANVQKLLVQRKRDREKLSVGGRDPAGRVSAHA